MPLNIKELSALMDRLASDFQARQRRKIALTTLAGLVLFDALKDDVVHGRSTPTRFTRDEVRRATFARVPQDSPLRVRLDTQSFTKTLPQVAASFAKRNGVFDDPQTGLRLTISGPIHPTFDGYGYFYLTIDDWDVIPESERIRLRAIHGMAPGDEKRIQGVSVQTQLADPNADHPWKTAISPPLYLHLLLRSMRSGHIEKAVQELHERDRDLLSRRISGAERTRLATELREILAPSSAIEASAPTARPILRNAADAICRQAIEQYEREVAHVAAGFAKAGALRPPDAWIHGLSLRKALMPSALPIAGLQMLTAWRRAVDGAYEGLLRLVTEGRENPI